jgi:hypothetical protein
MIPNYRSYINDETIDFSTVEDKKATQEWELVEDSKGDIDYPTRYLFIFIFFHMTTITIFIGTK